MQTTRSMRVLLNTTMLVCLLIGNCSIASGQLFGERTLGRTLSKGKSPRQTSTPGTLDGDRRFLRDQRDVTDFVGAAPAAGGEAGFVGGSSAVTAVTSSVTGLREQIRPSLNRPRLIRNSGIYPERLSLAPELQVPPTTDNTQPPTSSALQSFIQQRSLTIEVSAEDQVATLRGAVPSEHDRRLVEAFVMFEPGIQRVVNDLTVNPPLPATVPNSKRRQE